LIGLAGDSLAVNSYYLLGFEDDMQFTILPLTIAYYDDLISLWKHCEGIGLSEADPKSKGGLRK
jgi:hypothetical protein